MARIVAAMAPKVKSPAKLYQQEEPPSGPVTLKDEDLNGVCKEYSLTDIVKATGNFARDSQLGVGFYGKVYRGTLPGVGKVAIKVFETPEEGGFRKEVDVLSSLKPHPNIVTLQGFARKGAKRMIIYELLTGGDVENRILLSQTKSAGHRPFQWKERLGVALDTAKGIHWLHNKAIPGMQVFHRDIKTANILLDHAGVAKLGDFGFAVQSFKQSRKVKERAGTTGYACPIYAETGIICAKSEVYSFGMVLMELLTSMPPAWETTGPHNEEQTHFLVSKVKGSRTTAVSMADARARWPQQVAYAVAGMALVCAQRRLEKRPEISEVILDLEQLYTQAQLVQPRAATARAGGA